MILSDESLARVKNEILEDDDPAVTGVRADIVLSIIETAQAHRTEIERLNEVMEWVSGHDQAGLDHLEEMLKASEERDRAEEKVRGLEARLGNFSEPKRARNGETDPHW